MLACRSRSKGEALAKRLAAAAEAAGGPPPSLEVMALDLDSLESVRAFAAAWEGAARPLHVLINNAGIFSMGGGAGSAGAGAGARGGSWQLGGMGGRAAGGVAAAQAPGAHPGLFLPPAALAPAPSPQPTAAARATTADGFESHMGTNHLAHFLLTLGLLPALRRGAADPAARARLGGARVVSVSSSMLMFGGGLGAADSDPELARKGTYRSESAYGRSKLAQVLFTRELRRRLAGAAPGEGGGPPRVQAYAVHPGYVLTDVVRSLPAAVQRAYRLLMARILLTPEQGARARRPGLGAFSAGALGGAKGEPVRGLGALGCGRCAAGYWPRSARPSRPAVNARRPPLSTALSTAAPPPSACPGARATLFAACSPDAWRASLRTGGFFNADTRPAVFSAAMLDDAAAGWLWDWSARRVQLPREWDVPAPSGGGGEAAAIS